MPEAFLNWRLLKVEYDRHFSNMSRTLLLNCVTRDIVTCMLILARVGRSAQIGPTCKDSMLASYKIMRKGACDIGYLLEPDSVEFFVSCMRSQG